MAFRPESIRAELERLASPFYALLHPDEFLPLVQDLEPRAPGQYDSSTVSSSASSAAPGADTSDNLRISLTGTGDFTPPGLTAPARVFLVGGGAAGSSNGGGGGGAGEPIDLPAVPLSLGSYPVIIGPGGAPGPISGVTRGGDGTQTSFGALVAKGGGAGGCDGVPAGAPGASGGGGGWKANSPGGAATSASGHAGGVGGSDGANDSAAGGGAASGVGTNGVLATGGKGADGFVSNISGANVTYAGGGGGSGNPATHPGGLGGLGGGGNGEGTNVGVGGQTNGTPNTGSGGGGEWNGGTTSGAGGSGLTVVAYPTGSLVAIGGVMTTAAGMTIHTFTATGVFTVSKINSAAVFGALVLVTGLVRTVGGTVAIGPNGNGYTVPVLGDLVTRISNLTLGPDHELIELNAACVTPALGKQIFVKAQRGITLPDGSTIAVGTKLQGYLTSAQDLSWPGSPLISSTDGQGWLHTLKVADPAVGAKISITVPAGVRWQFRTISTKYHTSAQVANRLGVVEIIAPDLGIVGHYQLGAVIINNSIERLTWAEGLPAAANANIGELQGSLPAQLRLAAGSVVNIKIEDDITGNMPGLDFFEGAEAIIEEWIDN